MDSTTTAWILDRVDMVAQKIAALAPTVWEMAYRQAYVGPIKVLAFSFPIMLVAFVVLFVASRPLRKGTAKGDMEDVCIGTSLVSLIVFAGTFIASCVYASDLLAVCLNPDYYALKQLMELVK